MSALILSANRFEDCELLVPFYRLREDGRAVALAAPERGAIVGEHGYEVEAGLAFDEVEPDDYDLLVIPGGKAAAAVRKEAPALRTARAFFAARKPVAAICHGPLVLASAGTLHGRRVTGYRTTAKELREAGALYEDAEVVVDGALVTSRQPADLPAFLREMMRALHGVRRGVPA